MKKLLPRSSNTFGVENWLKSIGEHERCGPFQYF